MSASPSPPSPLPRAPRPVWALLTLLFCLPLLVSALGRVRMVNDVETWLPAHDFGGQILAWSHANFDPDTRCLVSWDSSSLADPRVLGLADRLQAGESGREEGDPLLGVARVITPHEVLSTMLENGVPRSEAVHRLSGVLVGSGLLKVRLTEAGRSRQADIAERLVTLAWDEFRTKVVVVPPLAVSARPETAAAAAQDDGSTSPEAGRTTSDESAETVYRPTDWSCPAHDFQLRWSGIHPGDPLSRRLRQESLGWRAGDADLVEDCFFAPGAPVALSISLREESDEALRDTLAAVRQAALDVGIPAEELRLGGSPIGRVQLNLDSGRALWNPDYPWTKFYKRSPLGLSAVVGTLLAFVLLRSLRLAILVLVVALYTAAAVVALVPATGQTLNTVLIVMPNLLLVLTMSGAIHLANYWRHAAYAGVVEPVAAAVRMAFEPCLLASVTTAIGLASLLTSVLEPVRQFGLYSAIGCLLSLAMVLWVFPALLELWPGRPVPVPLPHQDVWYRFGQWVTRHSRVVSLACLALFGFSAWGLHWFRTETKVIRYFPDNSRIVQDYEFLEDHLAGIVGVDVILRFPPERKRTLVDAESPSGDEGEVASGGTVAAAEQPERPAEANLDLLQRLEVVRAVQRRLQGLSGVSGTLSLADFRRPVDERRESRTPRGRRLQIARKQIFETYADQTREFVTHAVTPLAVEQGGLPLRIEVGEEIWRIRTQCSVLTDRHYGDFLRDIEEALTAELRGLPGVDHVVTGTVPLFLRTQEAVLESLINSFGLAFVMIAGVMMYLLKGVVSGTITMFPNILPVAVVFGGISWYGIPIDIGTMITASVALGIAIDGTLHLLTWFRDGLLRGHSRSEAVSLALGHCAPAMWQTSTAIALGLLMLAFADLLLISRFGWLMAALIMAALAGDLVYLPALLNGALGGLIERSLGIAPAPAADRAAASVTVPETVPPA